MQNDRHVCWRDVGTVTVHQQPSLSTLTYKKSRGVYRLFWEMSGGSTCELTGYIITSWYKFTPACLFSVAFKWGWMLKQRTYSSFDTSLLFSSLHRCLWDRENFQHLSFCFSAALDMQCFLPELRHFFTVAHQLQFQTKKKGKKEAKRQY